MRIQFTDPHGAIKALTISAICAHATFSYALSPATLTWLGTTPGDTSSQAYDVSGDGSVVVGVSYQNISSATAPIHAFRWTSTGGMISIGDLPGGSVRSNAYAVSADGSAIVGSSSSTLSYSGHPYYEEPFRWTPGGMQGLGYLSSYASSYGSAYGVSANGSVVVGSSVDANGNERPFRWTQSGGMVSLGTLTNYSASNQNGAADVSADGSIVVGFSTTETGRTAFRWSSATGMQSLGTLPGAGSGGGELYSYAAAISADGTTIVGSGYSASGIEAFRWTSAGGMVGLGDLPGGFFSSGAADVSANGAIIVGQGSRTNGGEAVRWDPVHGIQSIRDLLIASGVLFPSGWELTTATGISDDGQTIVGIGYGPGNSLQGWVATIPVPEPTVIALISAGTVGCATKRRRRCF